MNLLEVNLIFPAKEPLHVHGPLFRGKVDLHSTLLSPHNQAANYSKYSKKEKNLQRQGWAPNVYKRFGWCSHASLSPISSHLLRGLAACLYRCTHLCTQCFLCPFLPMQTDYLTSSKVWNLSNSFSVIFSFKV